MPSLPTSDFQLLTQEAPNAGCFRFIILLAFNMWFCSIIKNQQKTCENLKSFGGKLLFSNINFLCKKKKKPFSTMDGNELIVIFLHYELGCSYRLTLILACAIHRKWWRWRYKKQHKKIASISNVYKFYQIVYSNKKFNFKFYQWILISNYSTKI